MTSKLPTVLALDFDGVVCDGLKEYFQTSWRAYCDIWQPENPTPPSGLAETFYRVRPVIETGWEMPLVLRSLLLGTSEEKILQDWQTIAADLLKTEELEASKLMAAVDGVRDRWIAADLQSWLAEHGFYDGVIDRLKELLNQSFPVAIISTKEGRFIQQLLQQQGVDVARLRLYGKESRRPKHQVLRELQQEFGADASFWFVEDRLKTLQSIQKQPDLAEVGLFLADWGYNTEAERAIAAADPTLHLISLSQFRQAFPTWLT